MKRSMMAGICSTACACLLAGGLLAGCAGTTPATQISEEQQTNRAYMSQVSEMMDQLDADFATFVDAVSRGDIVNMRTQANNAYKTLARLDGLEVPEDLADVGRDYKDGTAKLREALDGYIGLYTEIDAGAFDQSEYDGRIADIQKLYDDGITLLEQADQAAAAKE